MVFMMLKATYKIYPLFFSFAHCIFAYFLTTVLLYKGYVILIEKCGILFNVNPFSHLNLED